jgi:hypothetical protein
MATSRPSHRPRRRDVAGIQRLIGMGDQLTDACPNGREDCGGPYADPTDQCFRCFAGDDDA